MNEERIKEIFADEELLLKVNNIIHPAVYDYVEEKIAECKTHIGHGRLNLSTWVAFWEDLLEEFDKQS